MMEPHFTTVFCAMFLTNLLLLHSLSICQSVLSAGMPKSVEIIPFILKLLHAWKLCNYLVWFFLKFILLTTFCFWKFKKFNFFYILRWTMTNLNFDFIFLQEAKGAWCFVYNHRSSTGNTNPRQRRIYTSQVSHQCALTQLIITFNYQECCLTLIFCLHRVCRPKPKSKGGESNAKEISDVWSCCFPYFNTCM